MSRIIQIPRKLIRYLRINVLLGVEPIWRYVMNFGPTLEFKRKPSMLNGEGQRVLGDVNKQGCAQTTLDELTGDPSIFQELTAYAYDLEKEHTAAAEAKQKKEKKDVFDKSFVVTMLDPDRPQIDPNGFLAKLALNPQIKGIADSYYGMSTRITDINIWRNLVTGDGPQQSQLWHRDLPEDHMILKMFIYIEDVPEGAGPLSYVKGTHGKGRRGWNPKVTHDGHNWRATDETMRSVTSDEERATFVGNKGTVLFADTFGWHKGGHAKTQSRFVVQVLFASESALPDRLLALPSGVDIASAPKELKYDRKSFKAA
jgi:hypothetical protein